MSLISSIDETDDLGRVGIEIRRDPMSSWRETVARYARLRNMISPATIMFDRLVSEGVSEPWAALRTLDYHGCTDVIVDRQHIDLAKMRATLT
jgi:hypothetical protein